MLLDRAVTVDAAARADIVWNVVDAKAVVVAQPLAGSLLAPTAPVQIDADVSGQVIADSVVQRDGTVGGTPFAAELPKVADTTTTTEPPPSSTQPDTSAVEPAAEAVPETVPPATGNNAVITVKVGSERPSASAVNPLPGVTLQLFDGVNAPTTAVPDAFATCVSDLNGDCSFIVPNTQQVGGTNRDRRFWVVRTGTPTGWFAVTPFVTGANAPFSSTPYQFRTGDQLRAGSTYASSGTNATFMLDTGNTNNAASGGIWQSSRNNPSLPATCGLSVALVLDVSGSVASSLASLKTAAKTFTNSLVGTPSQVALFTFATAAPANTTNNQNRPVTPVSTQTGADTVNGWIDGLTAANSTNWDRGIEQVAESGTRFDVAIVITDGNPTVYGNGQGPGNFTRLRELENGIFSANTVKAKATRMIALGVGAGVSGSPNNLISISGPTANSDYYQTNDYTAGRRGAAGARPRELQGHDLGRQAGRAEHGARRFDHRCRAGRRLAVRRHDDDERRRHQPDLRHDGCGQRRAQLQPDLPGRHDDGARDGDRDAAGRLHAGPAGRTQRDLSPARHERRGHRHELRRQRLPGDRGDHVPGQLHRVQPRALTCGHHRRQQEVAHQRSELRPGDATVRASTPRSPSAAWRRAGVWCAPASSRATRRC